MDPNPVDHSADFDKMFAKQSSLPETMKETGLLDNLVDEQTAENSTATKAAQDQINSTKLKKSKTQHKNARLDNYEMRQHIGEGAFGSVNLAIEKATGKKVAVKAVDIDRICSLNKERHILREKDLLMELKHPNIIQLFSTFKVSSHAIFLFSFRTEKICILYLKSGPMGLSINSLRTCSVN